ncbi:MAG: 5,6-dimethylbenzimidazole synthase, partial [Kiloniellales bacterium]|nr:5,6-dimethylbenzimidazole synthase [Kiloniellales bacterium]
FRWRLDELLRWRRDVRRFRRDRIPNDCLNNLLEAANLAPSVGLSQPWRFVVVEDPGRRRKIIENFKACNRIASDSYEEQTSKQYAKLKLAGLEEAPVHLAVYCDSHTEQGRGLGRNTMPEMLLYSVVAAIQNLWLTARSNGVGVGWVSILDPELVNSVLEVSNAWKLVAYLCIGYPAEEHLDPELERHRWESRRPVKDLILKR